MINEKLLNILIFEEGLKLDVYKCSNDKNTIGVGRNIDDNPFDDEEFEFIGHNGHKGITKEQAFWLLRRDMAKVEEEVVKLGDWVKELKEDRYCALCSMIFQMGLSGVRGFRNMLTALAQGSYTKAFDECLDSKFFKIDTPNRATRTALCFKTGKYELKDMSDKYYKEDGIYKWQQ